MVLEMTDNSEEVTCSWGSQKHVAVRLSQEGKLNGRGMRTQQHKYHDIEVERGIDPERVGG